VSGGQGVLRSCSHERLGAAVLNQVSMLIQDFSVPGDDASPSPGLRLQRKYCREGVDRIAEDNRSMKLPFEDAQEREGVDARRLAHESGGDGQTKQSMSHGSTERVDLGRRMISMKRIEISRETREEDNIGFGHGSSGAFPLISDHEIIE
jgi:hypothetical protein